MWKGCFASTEDSRVLMCVVALNGYHGVSAYKWIRDGIGTSEDTPLLYASCPGTYSCVVVASGQQCVVAFCVTGEVVFIC